MIIRYISDLHLEFIKPNKIENLIKKIKPNLNEICILAGDIGKPKSENYNLFMKHVDKSFKKTFIIPGNHEYYNHSCEMNEIKNYMKEYFKKFDNISFLDNSYEIYEERCFIGTTLWSKITNPSYEINDVYNIQNFDYIKYNRLNLIARDFLENAVINNDNCIIITHHIPSNNLIDPKYKTTKMLPYNQWFYCNMDDFIEKYNNKIKCWVYGHTHMPAINYLYNVPLLCNPIGYPNENPKPNFEKIFIV